MSDLSEYVRLLPYGYAPGNYMSKCFTCEKVFPDMDKRATRCRPCAEAAFKDREIERLRAEEAGLREDAERYRWLRPRLFSADFDYNENGIVALVFEMPPSTQFWADCDMTVDAARKGEA